MGKHFLWDPVEDNIVKEIDDAGSTVVNYTTEPNLYGDLISQHRDGQSSFYHFDGQGSTLSLTDSSTTVTDTFSYSAFGEVTARTGNTSIRAQYVGEKGYIIACDGRYYMVRRRGLSLVGRWLAKDLRPMTSQYHAYMYVMNRAPLAIDPSGMVGFLPHGVYDPDERDEQCLPLASPPAKTSLALQWSHMCGIALYGHDATEDRQHCSSITHSTHRRTCQVCDVSTLEWIFYGTNCCQFIIKGHRGGAENDPGMINHLCKCGNSYQCLRYTYSCSERVPCNILDIETVMSLGQKAKHCGPCILTLDACESGSYAGRLIDHARLTGCIVCGAIQCSYYEHTTPAEPWTDVNFRCVNSKGEQVGTRGPSLQRICGRERGVNPAKLARPRSCKSMLGR